VADIRELGGRGPAGTVEVTRSLYSHTELVEVDDDRDALRRTAGRRLCGAGYAEPRRRGHEGRDGEADDVAVHGQPHAFADR
jgi:hypothetical protein